MEHLLPISRKAGPPFFRTDSGHGLVLPPPRLILIRSSLFLRQASSLSLPVDPDVLSLHPRLGSLEMDQDQSGMISHCGAVRERSTMGHDRTSRRLSFTNRGRTIPETLKCGDAASDVCHPKNCFNSASKDYRYI